MSGDDEFPDDRTRKAYEEGQARMVLIYRDKETRAKIMFTAQDAIEVLGTESDRGCMLVGGAILDEQLEHLLVGCLTGADGNDKLLWEILGHSGPLGPFSARINMVRALDIVDDDTHADLHTIRKLRNASAHFSRRGELKSDHNFSFGRDAIRDRIASLRNWPAEYVDFRRGDPRQAFIAWVSAFVSTMGEHAFRAQSCKPEGGWEFVRPNLPERGLTKAIRDHLNFTLKGITPP